MDKKLVFIFASIFLLCASLAQAADFNAALKPVTEDSDKANKYESAKFELSIENLLGKNDMYKLYFLNEDVSWSILTDPLSDKATGMDVSAGQTKTTTILLKPLTSWTPGIQNMVLEVKSTATGATQTITIPVFVTEIGEDKEYSLTLKMFTTIPAKFDPREKTKITIGIQNMIPVKRTGLKLVITDELGLINQNLPIALDPLARNDFDMYIELDSTQKPALDTLSISLFNANDELLKRPENNPFAFEISSYSVMKETEKVKNSFLKTTTTITVENSGNSDGSYIVKRKVGFFENLFLRTSPRAKWAKIAGEKFLAWQIIVPAQSIKTVKIVESYIGLVLLIIAIIALIAAYLYMRPPIVITKRAGITKTKEGGISELKVVINVKNRGRKSIQDVKVVDSVPDIADVEENFQAGTIKPDNITRNITNGTLVKWNLGRFEGKEERVISYRIRSRLTIIGYMKLRPAVAKFSNNNKESKTHSNSVKLHIKKKEFGLE
jgi:hypothetical protein